MAYKVLFSALYADSLLFRIIYYFVCDFLQGVAWVLAELSLRDEGCRAMLGLARAARDAAAEDEEDPEALRKKRKR